jgi:o-succinylbenzoate synthase
MELTYKKHILKFRFDAGTSRGVYREKLTWIIKFSHNSIVGYGECGPLQGLSPESEEAIDDKLKKVKDFIKGVKLPDNEKEVFQLTLKLAGYEFPALRFALETALLDFMNGGSRIIFNNGFVTGENKIPINGLIWMGDTAFMKRQIDEKPPKGFRCLKMKIGALNIEEELNIIEYIRSKYPDMIIRLDANGAFNPDSALDILKRLSKFNIHSIEQPLKAGQPEAMRRICEKSPVPVALDEELIGKNLLEDKLELLQYIQPQFIILKPTLSGGFAASNEWISVAEKLNIGWWLTSALESNIGLNAIAQYTEEVKARSFQGLGTGQLYHNNFESPLTIENGSIFYDMNKEWNIEY